ncbi:MAG: hypothetical protein RMJ33_04430 [Saprospiraceae bacterium]|nr:DUF3108 domain-containing protein [Saprospiraceae bacterium]MDW8229064.1 hypothetical protein [Saprospiraceae bacterium]
MLRFTAFLMLGSLLLARSLAAQNCSEIFDFFREGVLIEYMHYDKKGKAETISTHRIKRIERSRDTLIAQTDVTVSRAKDGKETYSYSVPIKCHEGVLFMSMRGMVPTNEAGQSPDMQMEISGGDLAFPRSVQVGQKLPDSEMEIAVRMGNIQLLRSRYAIKDRKVEAEETVSTPAGTFKCYKISYNFEYQLMGTRTSRNEVWYAPSVGTVKSVSYDNKGNVESRMELTKFSK